MPFWKKEKKNSSREDSGDSNGDGKPKEKINYKARLEHKQYLVSTKNEQVFLQLLQCNKVEIKYVMNKLKC